MGWFSKRKVNSGLAKTRNKMSSALDSMMESYDEFTEDLYTDLEEILVLGDVGVQTSVEIVEKLRERVRSERIKSTGEIKQALEDIIAELLEGGEDMGLITIPSVLLMIGVNGSGKTTTIGKLASMYKAEGKTVILGAADTFRAAAIDQLAVWADRAGVEMIRHHEGADPAAVVFDTIEAGKARDCDIIICDTAGRLQNKKNLMEELAKIFKVIDRELPYSDREILLVLDATTGQNAVSQAREFAKVAEITGIVLTKLDGTARGGIVLSIKNELKIPVKFIGVGEKIDDLQPFDPHEFARSLFEGIDEKQKEEERDDELFRKSSYEDLQPVETEGEEEAQEGAEIPESSDEGGIEAGGLFSAQTEEEAFEQLGDLIAQEGARLLGEEIGQGAAALQDLGQSEEGQVGSEEAGTVEPEEGEGPQPTESEPESVISAQSEAPEETPEEASEAAGTDAVSQPAADKGEDYFMAVLGEISHKNETGVPAGAEVSGTEAEAKDAAPAVQATEPDAGIQRQGPEDAAPSGQEQPKKKKGFFSSLFGGKG
ncbi:MAG: signal recognition particle-docking protein FtsY [Clostridia bacterium]|nr:signal recognition particle-docking protein FtsY [Clostridia bacterium]